ncbi:hypothetical protein SEUCBS139899_002389 [Sporothrix eucalyptigena]
MGTHVVVVSPARPAALLSYILARCAHPTTLVICSNSSDFVQQSVDDDGSTEDESGRNTDVLHTASLLQVAVARHIRVAFVPTVAHLRGFLAAFDLAASRVPAPPAVLASGGSSGISTFPVNCGDRVLIVYDFVQLHRGTSEWSSQGLSASAAVLVEAGWRTGLDVLIVESSGSAEDGTSHSKDYTVLDEKTPVLSTTARKQLQRAGYPLRAERIKTVLARWFTFRQELVMEEEKKEKQDEEEEEEKVADVPELTPEEDHISQSGKEDQPDELPETREETTKDALEEVPETDTKVGDSITVAETAQKVEARPRKTFVKDSEDEDDDLSDNEIYPIDTTI